MTTGTSPVAKVTAVPMRAIPAVHDEKRQPCIPTALSAPPRPAQHRPQDEAGATHCDFSQWSRLAYCPQFRCLWASARWRPSPKDIHRPRRRVWVATKTAPSSGPSPHDVRNTPKATAGGQDVARRDGHELTHAPQHTAKSAYSIISSAIACSGCGTIPRWPDRLVKANCAILNNEASKSSKILRLVNFEPRPTSVANS
jgi:hypothetical protein